MSVGIGGGELELVSMMAQLMIVTLPAAHKLTCKVPFFPVGAHLTCLTTDAAAGSVAYNFYMCKLHSNETNNPTNH